MKTETVSVVLPVHNQEDHIKEIVDEYERALDTLPVPWEMVLVTNACSDRSVEVCRNLSRKRANIKCLDMSNGGWGYAVKQGLNASSGSMLCYTNSARTSAETLVLTILYAISYPSVVVKANRKFRDNWRRQVGSLLYNLECRALFDLSTWDINGTPKIFPRRFEKLLNLERDDDLIDAEFTLVCRTENYPIVEVPVFVNRRHGGRSTTNYRSALNLYFGALQFWRQRRSRGG